MQKDEIMVEQFNQQVFCCPECGGGIVQTKSAMACKKCGLVVNERLYEPGFVQIGNVVLADYKNFHLTASRPTSLGSGGTIYYAENPDQARRLKRDLFYLNNRQEAVKKKFSYLDQAGACIKYFGVNGAVVELAVSDAYNFIYKSIKMNVNVNSVHVLLAFLLANAKNAGIPINMRALCDFLFACGFGRENRKKVVGGYTNNLLRLVMALAVKYNIKGKRVLSAINHAPSRIAVIEDAVQEGGDMQERLRRRMPLVSVEKWLAELNILTVRLIKTIVTTRYVMHPDLVVAGAIYAADMLVAKQHQGKRVFTQKSLSGILGLNEYSIRDAFEKYVSPLVKRDEKP